MSSSASRILKVYVELPNGKEEIRRFTTSEVPVIDSLFHFLNTTYTKFYQPPLHFLFAYEDESGDRITISSESELQEGLTLHTNVRGETVPFKIRCRFEDESAVSGIMSPSAVVTCPPSPSITVDRTKPLELHTAYSNTHHGVDEPSPAGSHRSSLSDDSNLVDDAASILAGSASDEEYVRLEEEPTIIVSPTARTEAPVVEPSTPVTTTAPSVTDLSAFINHLGPDRFGCRLCHKLFMGEAFLVTHIRNKHADAINAKEVTEPTVVDHSSVSVPSSVSDASTSTPAPPRSVEFSTQTTSSAGTSATQTDATTTAPVETIATQTSEVDQPKVEESNESTPQVEIDDVTGHHAHCSPSPDPEVNVAPAESASSPSSAPSTAPVVHVGVSCDGCGASPIVGVRYHCTACTNPGGYDLCQTCEATGDRHPREHVLLKMRMPAHIPVGTAQRHLHCPFRVTPTELENRPRAKFIGDVNLADGRHVHAGETLVKVWSVQNTGDAPWPIGTRIVFAGGDLAPESDSLTDPFGAAVPFAGPGDVVHLSIAIQVPNESGRFRGTFRLETPQRVRFGPRIWIDLVVPQEEETEQEQEQNKETKPEEQTPEKQTPQEKEPAASSAAVEAPVPAPAPVAAPIAPSAPSASDESSQLASEFAAAHLNSASSVQSQTPRFQYSNQLATLRAMGFGVGADGELCRYLLLNNSGDVQKVVAWLLANC